MADRFAAGMDDDEVVAALNALAVEIQQKQDNIDNLGGEVTALRAEKATLAGEVMRDVIYFINLIQEIQNFGIKLPHTSKPKVTCRVFEDNVGALELANIVLCFCCCFSHGFASSFGV